MTAIDRCKAALSCCLLVASLARAADVGAPPRSADDSSQQLLVLLHMPAAHFRPDAGYGAGYVAPAGSAGRRRVANALAREHGLSVVTSWPLPVLGVDCFVLQAPASQTVDELAARLSLDRAVAWAQPMHTFRPLASDERLSGLQPAVREWHLQEMHRTSTGRGVRVAIIDSGVQDDHPDLAGQFADRLDFVGDGRDPPEAHGTAVAGILAARGDERSRIDGVSPNARVLALRACRQASAAETLCSTFSLALALHAGLERGANVINMSLTGPRDRLIEQLIRAAIERGAGVVAAADRALPRGGFPADVPGVIAVSDEASGPVPAGTFAAPGTDIPTTLPGSRWGLVSGASYAAAHVSGLLALMQQARGARAGASGPIAAALVVTPEGRIDACASLGRAGGGCACGCPHAPRVSAASPR